MKTQKPSSDIRPTELSDDTMRRMINHLPDGPSNPWLRKKVMNRLPDIGTHRHSRVVNIAYAASGIILLAAWIYAAINMFSGETIAITYRDILYMVALSIITTLIPISYRTV